MGLFPIQHFYTGSSYERVCMLSYSARSLHVVDFIGQRGIMPNQWFTLFFYFDKSSM